MHPSNPRLREDLELVVRFEVPIVITSVGNPAAVVEPIRAYGGAVFADVATVRHAEKAAAAGVDGLVLLTAGAGGQTGWANPFAFVRAVRRFYDRTVVLAGGDRRRPIATGCRSARRRPRVYGNALHRDSTEHGLRALSFDAGGCLAR